MKHSPFASITKVAGLCVAGVALTLLSACGGGSADSAANDAGGSAATLTIYDYQGASYSAQSSRLASCKEPACKPYTLDMKVTGWFTVGSALPVSSKTNLMAAAYSASLNFRFDDGGYNMFDNFNKKNAAVKEFWVTTDQDGKIVDCTIDLQSPRDVQAGAVFSDLKLMGTASGDFHARVWNQLYCPMAVNGICNYDPAWTDNPEPVYGGFALSSSGAWSKRLAAGLG